MSNALLDTKPCPQCGHDLEHWKSSYHNGEGNQRYIYGWQCYQCDYEMTEDESDHAALIAAARELLQYRKQAGAINFQLEKADSYLHAIAALIDQEPQP